jgi:hypothetical protein
LLVPFPAEAASGLFVWRRGWVREGALAKASVGPSPARRARPVRGGGEAPALASLARDPHGR